MSPTSWLIGISGTSLFGIMVAFILNINASASIALDVAAQHGKEINQLRIVQEAIRLEMHDRTRDRYTNTDAGRDLDFIERRLEEIERKIDQHHTDD